MLEIRSWPAGCDDSLVMFSQAVNVILALGLSVLFNSY